jgi:Acetylornithine deacetylase/Succinyl-diaminopimelate desuccinylase and related deacylases
MLEKNKILQYLKTIYTKTEAELEKHLIERFENKYTDSYHENGSYHFFYNESPLLLVAHLDTVHKQLPGIFISTDGYTYSAENGIGADDRNGVVAILELYEMCLDNNMQPPSILFTCKEEIGGVGVKKFAKNDDLLDKISNKNLFIQFDRRGENDFVTYGYRNNTLFEIIESYNFVQSFGSYTDISTLMQETRIMGVNFSAGYHNAHRIDEYTNFLELQENIIKVFDMFPSFTQEKFVAKEEYLEPMLNYSSFMYNDRFEQLSLFEDDYMYIISGEELYEIIESGELDYVIHSGEFTIFDCAITELYKFYPEEYVNIISKAIMSGNTDIIKKNDLQEEDVYEI